MFCQSFLVQVVTFVHRVSILPHDQGDVGLRSVLGRKVTILHVSYGHTCSPVMGKKCWWIGWKDKGACCQI